VKVGYFCGRGAARKSTLFKPRVSELFSRKTIMKTLNSIRRQIEMKDYNGAQRALVEILRSEPQRSDAWMMLAALLKDPAKKAECYRRILRIEPNHSQAQAKLKQIIHGSKPIPVAPANIPNPFAESNNDMGEPEFYNAAEEKAIREAIFTDAAKAPAKEEATLKPEEQELADYVLKELVGHVGQSDIVRDVCGKTGWGWPEAEKFVQQVAQHKRHDIAKRQAPLLLIIGVGTLLTGISFLFIQDLRYQYIGVMMILGSILGFSGIVYSLRKSKQE
ncbi:MAG: tetratricopeptide repeat protein, partial [Anaerolineae bacterium]|nr:tetratricopeptide repeat protein [Anaerolineae bacterium]